MAWDNISFTSELEALARMSKTVCFGSMAQRYYTSRKTINRFLDTLQNDSLKIFDINLRQRFYSKDLIHQSLTKCNILKINDEELTVVAELFSLNKKTEIEICKQLLEDYQLKLVILTKGAVGSYVLSLEETS